MTETIYVKGSAKKIEFKNGGSIMKLSIHKNALQDLPCNAKGYISLKVCKRKETDEWGNTHYIALDTYDPNSPAVAKNQQEQTNSHPETELPF